MSYLISENCGYLHSPAFSHEPCTLWHPALQMAVKGKNMQSFYTLQEEHSPLTGSQIVLMVVYEVFSKL